MHCSFLFHVDHHQPLHIPPGKMKFKKYIKVPVEGLNIVLTSYLCDEAFID